MTEPGGNLTLAVLGNHHLTPVHDILCIVVGERCLLETGSALEDELVAGELDGRRPRVAEQVVVLADALEVDDVILVGTEAYLDALVAERVLVEGEHRILAGRLYAAGTAHAHTPVGLVNLLDFEDRLLIRHGVADAQDVVAALVESVAGDGAVGDIVEIVPHLAVTDFRVLDDLEVAGLLVADERHLHGLLVFVVRHAVLRQHILERHIVVVVLRQVALPERAGVVVLGTEDDTCHLDAVGSVLNLTGEVDADTGTGEHQFLEEPVAVDSERRRVDEAGDAVGRVGNGRQCDCTSAAVLETDCPLADRQCVERLFYSLQTAHHRVVGRNLVRQRLTVVVGIVESDIGVVANHRLLDGPQHRQLVGLLVDRAVHLL